MRTNADAGGHQLTPARPPHHVPGPLDGLTRTARDCLCVDNHGQRSTWDLCATVYAWTKPQVTVGIAIFGVSPPYQLDGRVTVGRTRTHRTATRRDDDRTEEICDEHGSQAPCRRAVAVCAD